MMRAARHDAVPLCSRLRRVRSRSAPSGALTPMLDGASRSDALTGRKATR